MKEKYIETKVSIIIPVYKVEQYLERCLESVVNQTYNNLEIILVDDGSPDKCPKMCDLWANNDSRIKVIHKPNGGLSSARNAGLDFATGDYISFVDSDDYISQYMIEKMVNASNKYDVPIVCCGRVRVSAFKKKSMYVLNEETVFSGKMAIKKLLLGELFEEAAWDKLYKAEIFDKRRFPDGEINEDIVQTIEILGSCKKVVHIGEPLYYYCENPKSITKTEYSKDKMVVLDHLNQIKEYIAIKYPELLTEFDILETRYCQTMLYLLLDSRETYCKYKDDFDEVFQRFKKGFAKRYVRNRNNIVEKIKGWLIYYKIYYYIHSIKNWVKKTVINQKDKTKNSIMNDLREQ